MSVRVEAMHNPARAERREVGWTVFHKLATIFLVGLVGGVGFSFVGLANRTIAPGVFGWAASSGLGLASGFTSRRALRGHTVALRLLAAVAAVIVSMLFVGWISGGDAGLAIPHPSQSTTDWNALLELTLAAGSAGLALAAWSGGRVRTPIGTARPVPESTDGAQEQAIRRTSPAPTGSVSIALPGARPGPVTGFVSRTGVRLRGFAQRVQDWIDIRPGPWLQDHLPKWNLSSRLSVGRAIRPGRVRLLGVEEHRCPYCLDVVERHDARGVVTCKVCHTRHHADCWAVAGMCQVPHDHR